MHILSSYQNNGAYSLLLEEVFCVLATARCLGFPFVNLFAALLTEQDGGENWVA